MRDVGKLIWGSVIGPNFGSGGDRLPNAIREGADLAHPFASEPPNDALHLWNEITL